MVYQTGPSIFTKRTLLCWCISCQTVGVATAKGPCQRGEEIKLCFGENTCLFTVLEVYWFNHDATLFTICALFSTEWSQQISGVALLRIQDEKICDMLRTWFKTCHSNCYHRKNCEPSGHKFLLSVLSWKDKGGNIFHTRGVNGYWIDQRLLCPIVGLTCPRCLHEHCRTKIWNGLLWCCCIHLEGFWFWCTVSSPQWMQPPTTRPQPPSIEEQYEP